MDTMTRRPIGIVLNGVTGRMGYRQHLVRSLLAIRAQGGLALRDGSRLWPEPVLVGRDEAKLAGIAARHELTDWTTDLGAALARSDVSVYFDAQVTQAREKAIRQAIEAGKHIYTEKPLAESAAAATELADLAAAGGLRTGVVQDKLFLPGIRKLKRLIDGGFFGRILSVRGEFGYWVFEGEWQSAQRPSWNYRLADGGGIAMDMLPHWNYLLEELFGGVRSVTARSRRTSTAACDETGRAVRRDGRRRRVRHLRVGRRRRRPDQLVVVRAGQPRRAVEFQVDGTEGSAVAGCAAAACSTGRPRRSRSGTRTCRPPSRSASSGRGARQRRLRQRVQGAVGGVPAARGGGRPVPVGLRVRRPRRAPRRVGAALGARGPSHRRRAMTERSEVISWLSAGPRADRRHCWASRIEAQQ
jgi:predicted dehydrogenase